MRACGRRELWSCGGVSGLADRAEEGVAVALDGLGGVEAGAWRKRFGRGHRSLTPGRRRLSASGSDLKCW